MRLSASSRRPRDVTPATATMTNARCTCCASSHRRARDLGFPIQEIGQLLALWQDSGRARGEVKALAIARAGEMKRKERELRAMRKSLEDLAHRCAGGDRPDCPILDDLAIGTA